MVCAWILTFPDPLPPFLAEAVMVATCSVVERAGAVYRPVLESVPGPDRLQVTASLLTPSSFAENCVLAPARTVTDAGATVTDVGEIVIFAEDFIEPSTLLIAVTVALAGEETVSGAV